MWKLNVGTSKKVGRPNYGSQGASVQLEGELSGDPLQDSTVWRQKIRELCEVAAAAGEEELRGVTPLDHALPKAAAASVNVASRFDRRRATRRQVRALELIAEQCQADLQHLAKYYFGVDDVLQLTRRQASLLIQRLQAEMETVGEAGSETQVA